MDALISTHLWQNMSLYCQMKPVCGFHVTPTDCQCSAQDSGRDGTHVQGDHPLSNSTHRGGGDLPLCVDQWRPKLSLEGHLWGRVPALGVSPAAGQGQCHPADASFRYDGLQLILSCCSTWYAVSAAGLKGICLAHLKMHEIKVILSVILNVQ